MQDAPDELAGEATDAPIRGAGRHPYRRGVILIMALLLVLWRVGTFDTVLVNAGLNVKPCGVTNGGTTVCGKQYEALKGEQQRLEIQQHNTERAEHEHAQRVEESLSNARGEEETDLRTEESNREAEEELRR